MEKNKYRQVGIFYNSLGEKYLKTCELKDIGKCMDELINNIDIDIQEVTDNFNYTDPYGIETENAMYTKINDYKDNIFKCEYESPAMDQKSTLVNELMMYLNNTSQEQIEKDWEESKDFNDIGPTVEEYLKRIGYNEQNNV
jgi:hypothetical protein